MIYFWCDYFLTDVCLPSDSVIGKPLLTGTAGGHDPVPYLHPGGQAAESSLGSPNHWRPSKPKRKTQKKRTYLSGKLEGESVFNLRAGRGMIMFVFINPDRLSKQSKTEGKRDLFIVTEGLISLFLCLSSPLGHKGRWTSVFASFFNLSDPQNLM